MRGPLSDHYTRQPGPSRPAREITVSLRLMDRRKIVKIEASDYLSIKDICSRIRIALLPGRPLFPDTVTLLRTGQALDLRLSLAENGVRDQDVLEVREVESFKHVLLYGCPSALETDGLAPECMLVKYAGSEEALL